MKIYLLFLFDITIDNFFIVLAGKIKFNKFFFTRAPYDDDI